MRGISFAVLPIRDHAFFEQAVLKRDLGQGFLKLTSLSSERLDLIGGRLTGGITGKALLAGFEELLGPAVIEVLGDAFLPAQLGDAVLAPEAFKNDTDLLLGRELPSGGSSNIPDRLLRILRSLLLAMLSHRVPL